ncbi:chitobiase/beta-hexosaminidase C-terminal domain-containing protein [Cytobacillus sp. FSL R5-0569]|uniref:chitobiase/beta-hexosaminidase C-terminal domain-containing protein n=1 Tax=Cytobacillus sp. FSL R5-0569 TaxID=2921649 RepID=UPI0030FB2099
MTIYSINNPLSDDGRNKLNHNFAELNNNIKKANEDIQQSGEIITEVNSRLSAQLAETSQEITVAKGTYPTLNDKLNVMAIEGGGAPSNVILFEDWLGGESVIIDTDTPPPADTTAPVLTITAGGPFTGTKTVFISVNETADIFYTLNGSTPTTSSTKYTAPLSVTATTTLKAFARDTTGNNSSVQTVTYTLDTSGQTPADTTPPVLTITPAATFSDTQKVNMSINETGTIWYTVDGSDPVTSGTRVQYSSTVTLTATTTVKVYAVDTAGNPSIVQSVTYIKESAPSGNHVQDVSLIFFKNSGITNGEIITDPETYFNDTEEFTLSVTFQPVISGSNAGNLLVSRFLVGASDNVMKFEWAWNDTILGNLYGTKADGTTAWNPQATTSAYTDKTKYYHLAFKRQGTALTIHVDNVQVASTSILTTDIVRQVSAQTLKIGQSGKAGLFKNVAYYNRALTTAELTQNYEALK